MPRKNNEKTYDSGERSASFALINHAIKISAIHSVRFCEFRLSEKSLFHLVPGILISELRRIRPYSFSCVFGRDR